MIAKRTRGWSPGDLIAYLMGPGRHNEHTDQHVIASWDGVPPRRQPPRRADGSFDVRDLVRAMTDPTVAAGIALDEPEHPPGQRPPTGPVWHVSLRNHRRDRVLSDQEWAEVITEALHRTGIAVRGELGGCRWVAVRHAPDHVHIAAVLVRQDNGRRVHPWRDDFRLREVCVAAEQRLGLTPTAPADRTAVPGVTRGEREKAERRGRADTSREWLRRGVRTAMVQTRDPEAFFRRLAELGVRVRPRRGPEGVPVGYTVADPDPAMTTADGSPVFYSGARLGRDLTLPKLIARWTSAPAPPPPVPPEPTERARVGRAERGAAVSTTVHAVQRATAAVEAAVGAGGAAGSGAAGEAMPGAPSVGSTGGGGPAEDVAGIVHSTGDVMVAMRGVLARTSAGDVAQSADEWFERAALQAQIGQPRVWGPIAAQLRSCAWRLAATRQLTDPRDRDAGVVDLIVAVTALVVSIAAYHEQRRCMAQAGAARRAAQAWRDGRGGAGRGPATSRRTPELAAGPGARTSPIRDERTARGGAGVPPARPVVPARRGRGPTRRQR